LSNHRTTAITTTPFRIDLMDDCIGMNRFTNHNSTPTTTRTSTTWSNGMVFDLSFAGYSLTGREDVASLANFLGRIVLTGKTTATHARAILISWMW